MGLEKGRILVNYCSPRFEPIDWNFDLFISLFTSFLIDREKILYLNRKTGKLFLTKVKCCETDFRVVDLNLIVFFVFAELFEWF